MSTTDITGRLLRLVQSDEIPKSLEPPKQQFLQTVSRIRNFCNQREPKSSDKVVYYSASCDLMHAGVIERIKKAK